MKKITLNIIIISISILFISCEDNDFTCSSEMAQSTVKGIYKDFVTQKKMNFDDTFASSFIEDNISIKMIRTANEDKNSNLCSCEAKLIFNVPEDFKAKQLSEDDFFYQNLSAYLIQINNIMPTKEELVNGINITYNLKKLDNGEIIAETYEEEKLPYIIRDYKRYLDKKSEDEQKDVDKELQEDEVSEEFVKNMSQEEIDLNTELKNTEHYKENAEYVITLKNYFLQEWQKEKENNTEIGKIYVENDELKIYYKEGGFMSIYDFNSLEIKKTDDSRVLIGIDNIGGGAGGNIAIYEEYLLKKIGVDTFEVQQKN